MKRGGSEEDVGVVKDKTSEPLPRENLPAEWVDIAKLTPWAGNPRHNTDAIQRVMRSIQRWGFSAPVVARRANGELIAGHTRVEAARRLGIVRVPVRFLDLTEDEAHKLAVADNRIAEEAAWDKAKLGSLLGDNDWRKDSEDMGFNDGDLHRLVGSNEVVELHEVDVSQARAEFWITVTGPLTSQLSVLNHLRKALADVPGVQVTISTTEV
jgi:hypothetical protein